MFYNGMFFQISDYPEIYREYAVKDQKLLAIIKVDTGPCSRQQFDYRKRPAAAKLKVEFGWETIAIISNNIYQNWFYLKNEVQ